MTAATAASHEQADHIAREICRRVRVRLQDEGIPLHVAADTAGLSPRSLSQRLSRGTVSAGSLIALCGLLGVKVYSLAAQVEAELSPAAPEAVAVVQMLIDRINRGARGNADPLRSRSHGRDRHRRSDDGTPAPDEHATRGAVHLTRPRQETRPGRVRPGRVSASIAKSPYVTLAYAALSLLSDIARTPRKCRLIATMQEVTKGPTGCVVPSGRDSRVTPLTTTKAVRTRPTRIA